MCDALYFLFHTMSAQISFQSKILLSFFLLKKINKTNNFENKALQYLSLFACCNVKAVVGSVEIFPFQLNVTIELASASGLTNIVESQSQMDESNLLKWYTFNSYH